MAEGARKSDSALRLAFASGLARRAGARLRAAFRTDQGHRFDVKPDDSPVSYLDRSVERDLRNEIANAYPDEPVIGEELGGGQGDALWIVDPLDGTRNFLAGIPSFCVSIAFVRKGRAECAAVYDPVHDEFFSARRGGGAHVNGTRLSGPASGSLLSFGWSHSPNTPYRDYIAGLECLHRNGWHAWDSGSASIMLCYVAAGRLAGCAERALPAWDTVPGLLIAEEAGCTVGPTQDRALHKPSPMYAVGPDCLALIKPLLQQSVPGMPVEPMRKDDWALQT
ncbi:MAG: inositol monophosphatase [Paracoccaceae bacterium]|nr:inositol monophosphatase [Paracoccaceae bacterium]